MEKFSHYFNGKLEDKRKERNLSYKIGNLNFDVTASDGVFSSEKLDFGTKLLLQSLVIKEDSSVLDLGCGRGAVGLFVLKKFKNVKVCMVDSSEIAVDLSYRNIKKHGLDANVLVSDVFSSIDDVFFDVIVTNPPFSAGKELCKSFILESFNHLNAGGSLRVVAPTNKGAKSYQKYMQEVFGDCDTVVLDKGFRVFQAFKK